ncbi:MFS general substrate transporter [Rhizodiscina lignyota]|uniref:MFS general substrate transporter n=1 Tax=Rhizodiscina lignyota TaxID=1504668 RepID=A0A9P4M2P0_9PEZI|nr:MFS general substrate transporter [Rhizodiscina lignyota]
MATLDAKDSEIYQAEHHHEPTPPNVDDSAEVTGFEIDETALPKGYYHSRYFVGSFAAIGFGLWAGTAAFAYAAPILAQINADIGPDDRYAWISLVYTVCSAVWFPIIGRLGDIFGRRYLMILGAVLAMIGSIVCATASSILVLVGGNVFLGSASAFQLSFSYVLQELLPMKYRYLGSGFIYPWSIAGSGFGPAIAYAFVTRYSIGWRGVYWFLLAINGAALICWVLFYFPPTFEQKHKQDIDSKMYWVKNFDYVGTFLFASGFVVFLLGLSWGGGVYPWKSAAVIAAIVVGFFVIVLFVLWEIYGPSKQPLMPMRLFLNGRWSATILLLGLGAGVYYAFAVVWPTQCAVLYANSDPMYVGYISVLVGIGFITGQISAGLLARSIGKTRYQCMFVFTVGGIFLACAATVTPDNKATQIALIYIGCVFIGWNESICLSNAAILVHDQREIGVAGGLAGAVRSIISSILQAVYISILTNRLTTTIGDEVPPALVNAGLPANSVAPFLQAITVGTPDAFASVQGANSTIIATGISAYKQANADAYRTVYLSTIAFSAIAVILTWFAPNTDHLMTGQVAATLHHEGDIAKEGKELTEMDAKSSTTA